jgi:hypothetical protein
MGTAQFKWSRDNASVASAVTGINAARTKLTVVLTKRDSVLRFQPDDWVEVTDDFRYFAHLPGEMRQVAVVDDVNLTIQLKTKLPPGEFDATNPKRHTRVIRWDQKGIVRDPVGNVIVDVDKNGGLIPVPAAGTTIVLEDGIQITLSIDNAMPVPNFLPFDYWMFAARVVDSSIDILTQAPPRGILHHYAWLAMVTFPSGPASNCRNFWPPQLGGCCCTITVKPQDVTNQNTLQSIINQNTNKDQVTICLQPGVYSLPAPLVLDARNANLTLEGCDEGAILQVAPGNEAQFLNGMMVLNQVSSVTLRGLRFMLPVVPFVAAGGKLAGMDPAKLESLGGPQVQTLQNLSVSIGVRPLSCAFLTIVDCAFFFPPGEGPIAKTNFFGVGVFAAGPCKNLTLENNSFAFEGGSQQSTQEPFQLLIGCAIVPATVIQSVTQEPAGGMVLSGTVVKSWNQAVTFRNNSFGSLSAAVLILSESDAIVFEENTADQCYSGFWFLGRRSPPSLQPFKKGIKEYPQELIQDPVFELGATIARTYPLPSAYNDPASQVSVSGVVVTIAKPPFPAGSLLAHFDVLLQLVTTMETGAAANSKPLALDFSLHISNNRIDAEATDANLGSSGGALVVWGDEQDPTTDLILCANRLKNNTTINGVGVSTATIVLVALCTITGNLILNESSTSPALSLFLLLTSTEPSGMAVTGNILQGGDNLPNKWKSFNTEL